MGGLEAKGSEKSQRRKANKGRGGTKRERERDEEWQMCVLTTESVVLCTPIIARGVGRHAGEEERNMDRSTLPSAPELSGL